MKKTLILLSMLLAVIWLLPTGVSAENADNENNNEQETPEEDTPNNIEEADDDDNTSNEGESADNSADDSSAHGESDSESDDQNDDADNDADDPAENSTVEDGSNSSGDEPENDEENDSGESKNAEENSKDGDSGNENNAPDFDNDATNEENNKENETENNSNNDKKETKSKEDNSELNIGTTSKSGTPKVKESSTSKLGHLSKDAEIYKIIGEDSSKIDSDDYINAVYYIKKQAEVEDEGTFYLISTEPSVNDGVVGWVKASDITTHKHSRKDKKEKSFTIKGNGTAYSKAWGSSKDAVYTDMSKYKDELFEVHKTEKVGSNVWYRGKLNDKTVWLHENFVTDFETDKVSELGHIKGKAKEIYETPGENASPHDVNEYKDAVYYIKEQATVNDQTYYHISEKPSSDKGTVGWMKAEDMSIHKHSRKDTKDKTFYVTGKGTAYDKAWGGSKDAVFENMSDHKGELFKVHKTEKVGNNTWYRGKLEDKTVWLHESNVTKLDTDSTSKLGHFKPDAEKIYETLGDNSSVLDADDYKNAVYYIKKKGKLNDHTYYLISEKPSSSKETIGWVKDSDMTTHKHTRKDSYSKSFYFTGEGNAYSKAWGGSKDKEYDLSKYRNEKFHINKTEKVGSNTWYRGKVDDKTVWAHSSYVMSDKPKKTSKLGHFKNSKVKIYDTLNDLSDYKKAGSENTNAVYYIKSKSTVGDQKYYLLSKKPSDKKEVVGWVKSDDMTTHKHTRKDSKDKTFYMTGKGTAYDKAWGGSQNAEFEDMSKHEGELFEVNKTEKVGNNTWYRGKFKDKTVWLHESYVTELETDNTSKLGKLTDDSEEIYETLGDESSVRDADDYKNAVYYIKEQGDINDQTYYLISKKPKKDTVGWVKNTDIKTHEHLRKDTKEKEFYINGDGTAYRKAWGGSKDAEFKDISKYEGDKFNVHKTETVGSNTWYRGKLDGKTVWLHESNVSKQEESHHDYSISLDEATNLQMETNPQTDENYAWVSKKFIQDEKVDADKLNLRLGPGTGYDKLGKQLSDGDSVEIIGEHDGWYAIEYNHEDWTHAYSDDVKKYLNPEKFVDNEQQRFQFLDLSSNVDVSSDDLNGYLEGEGVLKGEGKAFSKAAEKYNVNEMYLMTHAIHETGHGTSPLAEGMKHKDKTVYNMFGIGAIDDRPGEAGAKKAYDEGWTTPEKAIKGGAKFIGDNYIKSESNAQNTLYDMRWNPTAMESGLASHQYATDIGWAQKQSNSIFDMYQTLNIDNWSLEIPEYKK